ncbi:MAG: BACON domain-containing carbohydrate-binding protein, partial [Vicinamibacterales bacterium]|nr:BACON domain-containing carbohydrate-binding protein [Vicinamibacterales bacterium]
ASATPLPLTSPSGRGWRVAGVVDVNGDRTADLVWVNATDGGYQVSVAGRSGLTAAGERVRAAATDGRPVPLAVDAADLLEGATNYRGSYPRPAAVTFATRDGRQVQVDAFPGMVQVFAEPASNQAAVEAGIGRFRGLILSKVPLLGYYLVGVDAGTEATFIAGIRGTSGVLDALPNMAVGVRQAGVPVGETYFTDPRPVPLNVGPGVVVVDQGFDLRGHGSEVRQTVLNGGASVGGLVNLAVQCLGCNGRTSAHHIGLIIAAAAQGNSVFNPGTPMVANVSFGPDITDASGATLVAEQVAPAVVTANQGANETFLRSLLSVTRQIPAAHEHTVTFASGNSHVDLTSVMANLRADPGLATELEDHYALAGTGLASTGGVVFSNFVTGRDLDVVTSNNLEAMDGTSLAAPNVAAILDVVRARTGVSRDIALLAVKLIDEPDGQVAVDRAVEMARALQDAIPRIMAEAGVTRAQALAAIRGAVRNHATGAFIVDEAIDVARRLASRVTATPASLAFTGTRGQANPAPQAVTIESTGVALLWRVTANASWLSASPATGRTASPVTVSAITSGLAAGTYSASLTLTAVETGESVQVPVTLTVRESCTYTLSRTSVTVAAAGASGLTVGVTAASGCTWTATESSSFISITGGSSGSGSGTVNFTVSANTGAARSGTLTVAGQAVTVSQSAGTTTGGQDGLGAWTFRGTGCDRSADPLPGWTNCRGTITVTITQVNQSGYVSVFMAYPDSGSFYHGQVAVTAGRAPGTVSISVVNNYVPRCVSSYATTISVYDGTQSASAPPLIGRSSGTLTFTCN